MSTQSMLTIGAMVLLTLTSMRFNSSALSNLTAEIENKVYLTAFSLADDLIEEIKQKAYDEQTVEFRSINPAELTAPAGIGPDSAEVWPNFDDIDDYDGFSKNINLPHVENYHVTSTVTYVQAADPDQVSGTQTFFKKVEVEVSSPYLRDPITMSFIFTLHSK